MLDILDLIAQKIEELSQKALIVSGIKSDIRDAIEAKGVIVPSNTPFSDYPTFIALIDNVPVEDPYMAILSPVEGSSYPSGSPINLTSEIAGFEPVSVDYIIEEQ
jgi:hypothetical protein